MTCNTARIRASIKKHSSSRRRSGPKGSKCGAIARQRQTKLHRGQVLDAGRTAARERLIRIPNEPRPTLRSVWSRTSVVPAVGTALYEFLDQALVTRARAPCQHSDNSRHAFHEALLQLFKNRARLAPELLHEALHQALPEFTEVRIESAELTDIQPAEYRADLVVLLLDSQPVLGIVIEVQLARDDAKRYSWPVYVMNLRARIQCPVCLLVITPDEQVARWAATPIEIGGGQQYVPCVLSPAAVPRVTDPLVAHRDPELAVLSVMAHGRCADVNASVQVATAAINASTGLDPTRSTLYVDLILNALSKAAHAALSTMNPANYEYQSEFARRYFFEGQAQGKAELLIKLATLKFGPVSAAIQQRIHTSTAAELECMAERLLTATSLEEVLG